MPRNRFTYGHWMSDPPNLYLFRHEGTAGTSPLWLYQAIIS
jgi:hypothetical protein